MRTMSTLVQADIFFFISSIAVVLVTVAVLVVAYHVVKTVREIRRLIGSVREEVDALRDQRKRIALSVRFFRKWAANFISELARRRASR